MELQSHKHEDYKQIIWVLCVFFFLFPFSVNILSLFVNEGSCSFGFLLSNNVQKFHTFFDGLSNWKCIRNIHVELNADGDVLYLDFH
jgi:hypothetical protein